MPLSDRKIASAKPRERPFKLHDTGGLFLLINPGGSKLWRLAFRHQGRPQLLALGRYGADGTSLAEARERRDAARKLIAAGIHPKQQEREQLRSQEEQAAGIEAARQERERTLFPVVADAYFAHEQNAWSATHRRDVQRMLNELSAGLATRPMREITLADLRAVFAPMIERGVLTYAKDCRMYFRCVVKHFNATAEAPMPDPSARLDLPNPEPERGHAALHRHEIPAFLQALDHSDAGPMIRIATRLLLLTALRTTELRGGKWSEIDSAAGMWRIPAERMKGRRPHEVPLSRQAVALIEALRQITGRGEFMFPNDRDATAPMSENAILFALYRLRDNDGRTYRGRITGHGMRAMFSTILNEDGHSADAIERQLAHQPRDQVRAAYLRSAMLPQRRELMQAWADLLDRAAAGAAVIPLFGAHAA